jgi:hypothetical protein
MEGRQTLRLDAAPPLTWMAALGCAGDLVINRILLRSWAESLSREAFQQLDRWGAFSRNLAVVSGLVALGFCLTAYGSRKSGLPLSARIGIMGFGWSFIPIVTLMTFLPLAWTRVELVLVIAGLSHALILLLILGGIHWRSTKPLATSLGLLLVAYVSGIASLISSIVGGRHLWEHTERLAYAFRWSGELAFLVVPIALGFGLRIPWRRTSGKLVLGASALAGGLVAASIALWERAVGTNLETLFYGAFRLDLFAEQGLISWYAVPLGIGWAVTCAATLSRNPPQRQIGAALFLLLCTGYAPLTPSSFVMSALAVALVSRVALSRALVRKSQDADARS